MELIGYKCSLMKMRHFQAIVEELHQCKYLYLLMILNYEFKGYLCQHRCRKELAVIIRNNFCLQQFLLICRKIIAQIKDAVPKLTP